MRDGQGLEVGNAHAGAIAAIDPCLPEALVGRVGTESPLIWTLVPAGMMPSNGTMSLVLSDTGLEKMPRLAPAVHFIGVMLTLPGSTELAPSCVPAGNTVFAATTCPAA